MIIITRYWAEASLGDEGGGRGGENLSSCGREQREINHETRAKGKNGRRRGGAGNARACGLQSELNVDGACSADRDIDSGGGDEPTLKDFLDGPASKHGVGGGLGLAGLWAAVAKAFSCAPFSAGGGREYPARS